MRGVERHVLNSPTFVIGEQLKRSDRMMSHVVYGQCKVVVISCTAKYNIDCVKHIGCLSISHGRNRTGTLICKGEARRVFSFRLVSPQERTVDYTCALPVRNLFSTACNKMTNFFRGSQVAMETNVTQLYQIVEALQLEHESMQQERDIMQLELDAMGTDMDVLWLLLGTILVVCELV